MQALLQILVILLANHHAYATTEVKQANTYLSKTPRMLFEQLDLNERSKRGFQLIVRKKGLITREELFSAFYPELSFLEMVPHNEKFNYQIKKIVQELKSFDIEWKKLGLSGFQIILPEFDFTKDKVTAVWSDPILDGLKVENYTNQEWKVLGYLESKAENHIPVSHSSLAKYLDTDTTSITTLLKGLKKKSPVLYRSLFVGKTYTLLFDGFFGLMKLSDDLYLNPRLRILYSFDKEGTSKVELLEELENNYLVSLYLGRGIFKKPEYFFPAIWPDLSTTELKKKKPAFMTLTKQLRKKLGVFSNLLESFKKRGYGLHIDYRNIPPFKEAFQQDENLLLEKQEIDFLNRVLKKSQTKPFYSTPAKSYQWMIKQTNFSKEVSQDMTEYFRGDSEATP